MATLPSLQDVADAAVANADDKLRTINLDVCYLFHACDNMFMHLSLTISQDSRPS